MLDFWFTAIASILFVVDPAGAVPAYLVMTEGYSEERRRRTVLGATVTATATLIIFASAGSMIFRLFGLTLPAFQIAGGLILFLVALDMIRAERPTQEGPGEIAEGAAKQDVTITPMAIPLLAGPAALSTVTMLMSRAGNWREVSLVYIAIVLTGVITYAILRLARPLYTGLGRVGIHVLSRILGLILAAISVQFVLDGLRAAGVIRGGPPA